MINPDQIDAIMRQVVSPSGSLVEGIVNSYRVDLEALAEHREAVRACVDQLDPAFFASKGGGASFLSLCQDADGRLWTGLHQQAEALYILAAGLGMAHFCLSRSLWPSFPGGMPYIVFTDPA